MTKIVTIINANYNSGFVKNFVEFSYEGTMGLASGKWFPDVKVGQVWELVVSDYGIEKSTLLQER